MTAQKDDLSIPLYHIELVRDYSVPFKKLTLKENAIQVMHTLLDKSPVEKLLVLHISSAMELVGVEQVASGQLEMVNSSMNDIFRGAILAAVPMIYLCHNHPDGNPHASPQDLALTALAIKSGIMLQIDVLDHIIVSPNGKHFSIKENQQLLVGEIIKQQMEDMLKENRNLPRGYPNFKI